MSWEESLTFLFLKILLRKYKKQVENFQLYGKIQKEHKEVH